MGVCYKNGALVLGEFGDMCRVIKDTEPILISLP